MTEKTTVEKFKKVMTEMYRGYPEYIYYGLFHDEFGAERASRIITLLQDDDLIIPGENKDGFPSYKLTKKGVDFAIAMINLNFSEKIHIFNKRLYNYTTAIVILTVAMILVGLAQLILIYLQKPIF